MEVKVYFDKNRIADDGSIPVCLLIYRKRNDRIRLRTGMTTMKVFDSFVFPSSEKNHRRKTIRLNEMIDTIENICLSNPLMPKDNLKKLIYERVFGKETTVKTLSEYLEEYGMRASTRRTEELYHFTALKVEQFDKTATMSIDHKWLNRFYMFMLETMNINSAAIHLRNIRAVFNWCRVNEDLQNYPFRKFSIKKEETKKRSLTIEEIKYIRDKELKDYECRYRDAFMLMFYLIGINAVDLFLAERHQLVNGRLEYKRAKTTKLYSIKVEPEAMEIINKYRGKRYLLNFCEKSGYKHFLQRMNRNIGNIIDGITSYYSRHSWATIAYNNGISIDTISSALGHSHGSEVTNVYINVDQSIVDEANRKVLDLLKNNS